MRRLTVTLTTTAQPRTPAPRIAVRLADPNRPVDLDLTVDEARHLARELNWAVYQEMQEAFEVYGRYPWDRPPAQHWHVFAIEDWGGSLERVKGWDEPMTEDKARTLADDIVKADTLRGTPIDCDVLEANPTWKRLRATYGDNLDELTSSPCGPWQATWLIPCFEPDHCRYSDIRVSLPHRFPRSIEPYWQPEASEAGSA